MTPTQEIAERLEKAKGTGIDSVMVCGFYRHDVEFLLSELTRLSQELDEASGENARLREATAFKCNHPQHSAPVGAVCGYHVCPACRQTTGFPQVI
jgi:hypothetical protein